MLIELGVLNVESLSSSQGFPCGELRYQYKPVVPPGWYTTLWVLARYAATKRLNEHLRTPQQSRVNRTWLILSRKICEGKLPRVHSYFSFTPSSARVLLFFIMPQRTRSSVSHVLILSPRTPSLLISFSLCPSLFPFFFPLVRTDYNYQDLSYVVTRAVIA